MDAATRAAVGTLFAQVRPYWMRFTAPVTIRIPAANVDCDVRHALGVPPDGYHVIEADGPVYRRPGPWADPDLAYLRSSVAGTRATVIFFTLRED